VTPLASSITVDYAIRTPYGKWAIPLIMVLDSIDALGIVRAGYVVAIQDVRGTCGSGFFAGPVTAAAAGLRPAGPRAARPGRRRRDRPLHLQ